MVILMGSNPIVFLTTKEILKNSLVAYVRGSIEAPTPFEKQGMLLRPDSYHLLRPRGLQRKRTNECPDNQHLK